MATNKGRLSFIFIVLLLQSLVPVAEAQSFRVTYEYSFKNRPDGKYGKFNMALDLCENKTAFYNETTFVKDSLKAICFDERGKIIDQDTYGKMTRLPVGLRDFVLIDFESMGVKVYHQVATAIIIGEANIDFPQWRIVADSDTVLLNYAAKKAIANYMGREWIIYYTLDIPIPAGPWLLWGSPGLILSAHDSEDLFKFESTKIEQLYSDSRIGFIEWFHEERKRSKKNQYHLPLDRAEAFHYKMRTDIDFYNQAQGKSGNRAYTVDSEGQRIPLTLPPFIPLIPIDYWKMR